MERMYQDYRDIAEFRLVYIKEAHASDSSWPVPYAKEKGITDHKNYGQRCATAEMLLKDKQLTIPTVIDSMEDVANKAYSAWPDRVFLVRGDGKLAVAAKRGPWGYKPGIDAANEWLATFKKSGKAPALPKPSDADEGSGSGSASPAPGAFAKLIGSWEMQTDFHGQQIPATMTLTVQSGKIHGVWASQGMEMIMSGIQFSGNALRFTRTLGTEGPQLRFEGAVDGDKIAGTYVTDDGELVCSGKRKG